MRHDRTCAARRRRAHAIVTTAESEEQISALARRRYVAFLAAELAQLPAGHPLHDEYASQLAELRVTR